jgi:hypothetical protein
VPARYGVWGTGTPGEHVQLVTMRRTETALGERTDEGGALLPAHRRAHRETAFMSELITDCGATPTVAREIVPSG